MEKLQASFESWRSFVEELQSFKATLADQHERSLVRLIFLFASKIAQREVSQHPELIAEVVKDCVKRTQEDENVRILLSGSDLEFLKEMAEKIGRDLSFLKKVQLEESADITPGGCIVESNYGQIDATLETRVQKLWELLEPQLPPAKTIIKAS